METLPTLSLVFCVPNGSSSRNFQLDQRDAVQRHTNCAPSHRHVYASNAITRLWDCANSAQPASVAFTGALSVSGLATTLRDWNSAKDFATGDGSTENTVALVKATEAASARNKVLTVPAGIYVASAISVPATKHFTYRAIVNAA